MSEIILEARNLVKEFRGFVAVNNVNIQIRKGTIHALIGPNGAGKTTCFNLLTRFIDASKGEILFKGEAVTRESPVEIARRGLVRSFQISSIFPGLSVLKNVRIALMQGKVNACNFWSPLARMNVHNARAMELLAQVGLQNQADVMAGDLPYGQKRALEIVTTLAMDPEIMLLDEPTQGMSQEDIESVTQLIKMVSAGRTILLVEHNMNVIASIADTITVLQYGEVIAEGNYAQVSSDPRVLEAYIGQPQTADTATH